MHKNGSRKQFKAGALLSLTALLFLVCGCNTYQKQLKKSTAFFTANSNELARLCMERFPNKETFKPGKTDTLVKHDTTTIKGDSIPCPQAKDGKTVFVKCPDQKIITQYVHTIRVDTIETKGTEYTVLTNNYEALEDSLLIVKQDLKTQKEVSKNRSGWILKLSIALAIVAGLAVLKFIGKI